MSRLGRYSQFVPGSLSKNFSDFPKNEEGFSIADYFCQEDDQSVAYVDELLLQMLGKLKNDRERVVLLMQVMRGDGYSFDHKDIARLLRIHIRWYYRILEQVKKHLTEYKNSKYSQ